MKTKIALLAVLIVGVIVFRLFAQQGGMNEKTGTPTYVSELHVLTTVLGNVGLIVDMVASATGDMASFRQAGTVVAKIGPNGHVLLRQYTKTQIDTLVPDYVGVSIIDTNGAFPYNICTATGTLAAQWFAVMQSTGGVGSGGIIGGTKQSGCGTNN